LLKREYDKGRFKPERGIEHNWHVWCSQGLLEVLEMGEHEFADAPDPIFTINVANNAMIRALPGDEISQAFARVIAAGFTVEVFPVKLSTDYVPWKASDRPTEFDAVRITRTTVTPEKPSPPAD
jgi:hypothetical protein